MRSPFVSAGGFQTLKSEEWERQEQKTLGLFACALHSIERNETDSHRELSRLPLARSPVFGTITLRRRTRRLLFIDLPTFVAADSDLTSLHKEDSLKEVIQPHLPVRLPCYDFTPLTGHSFGASVPHGFGQRLREHQTRVM